MPLILDDKSPHFLIRDKNNELFIQDHTYGLAGRFLILFVYNLNQFLRKNLSSSINLNLMGITRSIEQTLLGGANRSRTSKHASGLAVDVRILSSVHPLYCYGVSNECLAQDKKLMCLIDYYINNSAYKKIIKWGGHFIQGQSVQLNRNLSICIDELHHFEISEHYLSHFFIPYLAFFRKHNLTIPHAQKELGRIYEKALELETKEYIPPYPML